MCARNKKRFDFTYPSVLPKTSFLNDSQNNAKWDICSLKTKYFFTRPTYAIEVISTYLNEEYACACRQRRCLSPKQPEIKG